MTTLSVDPRHWHWLGHPWKRDPAPKGLDAISQRARGWWSRRGASRDLRSSAESIVSESERSRDLGESALKSRILEVRDAVVMRHDERSRDAAFALMREAIRRELGLALHPEQMMGAVAMSRGAACEMATGEGKTLTAILPAALWGWSGHGVHVVTVNDYLASRDADISRGVFARLGLDVGVVTQSLPESERREAYARSVTYVSDKQVIFDHLRDRLKTPPAPRLVSHLLEQIDGASSEEPSWPGRVVQRGLFACVVDEADSVLIDEAVTPAIIATDTGDQRASRAEVHHAGAALARSLKEGEDFIVDRRLKRVHLTPAGREALVRMADSLPPFWQGPRRREELVVQAITAQQLFTRDDDYVVVHGKVQIVDPSTGRILDGRQWQLGLHQAVEAKEGVEISEPRRASARTAYQQFFQRYQHLCGMSGTLWEVRHELWSSYDLPVVRIPTHRPIARQQTPDAFFRNEADKFAAVADAVEAHHAAGRPVLIGTRSVAASERMAALLGERSISCSVLNANRETEEAAIIARAGEARAVTVATNMAGRGTDIRIDTRARQAGGLAVLATERHDERRVDRQLFGRSGRQGDPGIAQAFVSLDDALIVRHGLKPLVAITAALPAPAQRAAARALWRQSQWAAGVRAATVRAEVARSDARLEQALRGQSR